MGFSSFVTAGVNIVPQNASPVATAGRVSSVSASASSVEQTFLDYMKKSPAERMIEAWLKAHHLTEEDLKKMSPEKRTAIEKQMAEDIQNSIEQRMKDNLSVALG